MDKGSTTFLSILIVFLYQIYRRFSRISVSHVPGPPPDSFLLGSLPELLQSQAGMIDFKWQASHGDVVRLKAAFGEDWLMVSDPKALQYIYQTSGYHMPKPSERKVLSYMLVGHGVSCADGEVHKRQRKVMLPGFGAPESRAFIPLFASYAASLSSKWKDIISDAHEQSAVLNIPIWFSRVMLDAIGEAAFDYHFGVLEDADNELGNAYLNLISQVFGSPSKTAIFVMSLWKFLPRWLIELSLRNSKIAVHSRNTKRMANRIAKTLVEEKTGNLLQGKTTSRDIMSLLVQSNISEEAKARLSDDELIAQMRTLILAGHETTANSLSWTLLELAKNPEIQHKLRSEIRTTDNTIRRQGRTEFTQADFDNMPYTSAVIKEALRFHPVSYHNYREAGRDDVLPLSTPILTPKGEVLTKLPIPKGQRIITSIAAYNRNKKVFGEDAHVFNPDRWTDGTIKPETSVGVYANLLTFAGGVRSCIGWRFAVLELHAFLIELISNFEFSMTPEAQTIRREACLVMLPTVEGQFEKGSQLPLRVTMASPEE